MNSPKNKSTQIDPELGEKRDSTLRINIAAPELLELADRVRYILNTYPPNDPVVREIRQSEAYRRVVHLIEEPSVPWPM